LALTYTDDHREQGRRPLVKDSSCARRPRLRLPSAAGYLLLVLLAGCHAPPAVIAPTDPLHPHSSRALLLARQVTVDSAVAVAAHPLRCGRNAVVETADHIIACSAGAVGKRVGMSMYGPPPSLEPWDDPPPDASPDKRYRPAHVELYPEPDTALDALHCLIDQAVERIDIMMFLWESDDVGSAVAEWLSARAAAGVHVRVLVDGGGNLIFSHARPGVDVNAAVCALASHPNVEMVRTRDPFCCFDHRKLVIADGCRAWSGGRNLTHKSFYGQRDVSLVVSGPLVVDLQQCYEEAWQEQGGRAECGVRSAQCGVKESTPHSANAWARLIKTTSCGNNLAPEVYHAVDTAQHYIILENGYLSDGRLVCKLAEARQRGVDVRVVLTLSSKESVVDCANRVTANRLRAAGVRVYVCPRMTHMKAGVIDGCWAYLGTGNYDALSFRHNCELGMVIGAGPLLHEMQERLFAVACRPEWELTKPMRVSVADYFGEMLMCLCL
jgi:cardiolipin synthase